MFFSWLLETDIDFTKLIFFFDEMAKMCPPESKVNATNEPVNLTISCN